VEGGAGFSLRGTADVFVNAVWPLGELGFAVVIAGRESFLGELGDIDPSLVITFATDAEDE
jgi:hypothetical protein